MTEAVAPIVIVTPSRVYKPVGRCIYCGRMSRKLGKEHILPFGIAANSLILPKASCRFDGPRPNPSCSDITRDFETACLRHMWWPFRTKLGAPSRGKEVAESFALRRMKVKAVENDGSIKSYERGETSFVSPDQFPMVYPAFLFPPPGVLVGRDPTADVNYEIWAAYNPRGIEALGFKDKEGIRIAPGHPIEFSKLLAKIAHSYAVAELGYNGFEHRLTYFIRGAPMRALEWIGGNLRVPPPTQTMHDIRWRIQNAGDKIFVVVDVRLFSFVGTPQYHVVVGELKRPLDELPFLEQPLYTIDVEQPLPSGDFIPFPIGSGTTWPQPF